MAQLEGKTGPIGLSTGSSAVGRLDGSSAVVVQEAHGRYAESCRRGAIFSASTPFLGTQAAAAHVSPVAAAAATLLSLYNPIASGKVLSILRVTGEFVSSTVEVGCYSWNFHGLANVSAAMSAAFIRCMRASGSASPDNSVAKAFTGEAITGGVLGLQGPFIGMWATALTQRFDQNIDGMITIPQGGMVTIAAPTAGTATFSAWSIWYEELALTDV